MMRSLWTAASGMIAQQTNVDVISNNLANVNTTGYKTESAQFKTLLYQTTQAKTTSANGETKPVGGSGRSRNKKFINYSQFQTGLNDKHRAEYGFCYRRKRFLCRDG